MCDGKKNNKMNIGLWKYKCKACGKESYNSEMPEGWHYYNEISNKYNVLPLYFISDGYFYIEEFICEKRYTVKRIIK